MIETQNTFYSEQIGMMLILCEKNHDEFLMILYHTLQRLATY